MDGSRVQFEVSSNAGKHTRYGRVVDKLDYNILVLTESPEKLIWLRVDQVQRVPEFEFPAPE